MESRGQRGFKKGKLVMTFYRALAKPPPKTTKPTNMAPTSTPMKPKDQPVTTTATGGGGSTLNFIIKQDQVGPPSNAKVSFFVPEVDRTGGHGFYGNNNKFGDLYGVVEDEAVDLKAASYISTVQERFQLERCNSRLHEN